MNKHAYLRSSAFICGFICFDYASVLVEKKREHLDYADPAALDKRARTKDFLLLCLIGTVFGICFLAFLFWWTLFR